MNWVFDAYSSVYKTAMLQSHESVQNAASAKERVNVKRTSLSALFGRR